MLLNRPTSKQDVLIRTSLWIVDCFWPNFERLIPTESVKLRMLLHIRFQFHHCVMLLSFWQQAKGDLISESILTLVPLPKRCQITPLSRNLKTLLTGRCRKFKFSAQMIDLAPFVGNETKIRIPSEIKRALALRREKCRFCMPWH